jgi:hypothetical protein
MAIGDYAALTWVNGSTKVNATNMNHIENKIYELDQYLSKQILHKKKAAYETRYNTTTLTDDADLVFSLTQTGIYKVDATLYFTVDSGASEAGLKKSWAVTGGVTGLTRRLIIGPNYTDTTKSQYVAQAFAGSSSALGIDNGYDYGAKEEFLINVASAGTLKLQWAQNEARAWNIYLLEGSFVVLTKVIAA